MPTMKILLAASVLTTVFLYACSSSDTEPPKPTVDLLTAIDKEDVTLVQQHLKAGTDLNNYPRPEGLPLAGAQPLHRAVVKGNIEIVRLLLANGVDINLRAKNKDKAPALSWAVVFLQKKMVSLLIESGADINIVDANGATAVDAANYIKVLSLKDEKTLLIIDEILKILIKNGGLSVTEL